MDKVKAILYVALITSFIYFGLFALQLNSLHNQIEEEVKERRCMVQAHGNDYLLGDFGDGVKPNGTLHVMENESDGSVSKSP